jgi:uncharacterized protein YjbI with pentapeptide repeats
VAAFLFTTSFMAAHLFLHNSNPAQKKTNKTVRYGVWIPITAFLVLSVLASALMTIQAGNRCKVVSDGMLWGCDFAGADLSGIDFSGADMSRINLAGANLSGSNLSEVMMPGADLTNSNLAGADLSNAWLKQSKLDGADLTGAVLDGAFMKFASLVGVKGLTQESLANLDNWSNMLLQSEEEMLAKLWQVCDGRGVEKAAQYSPDKNVNSILIFSEEGEKHSIYGTEKVYDSYWMPESVSNTELVACFEGPYKVGVGSCDYEDGISIKKYMLRVDMSIYVAQTGELLEEITLDGVRPDKCPEKKVEGGERPDYIGDAPYGIHIIEALTPFVNEDGVLPPPNLP